MFLFGLKFHGVPMLAFSDDGLSIIATKLRTLLMLNLYTFDMCIQSWDRSSYVATVIGLPTDEKLERSIVVPMPKLVGAKFSMCIIHVDYE